MFIYCSVGERSVKCVRLALEMEASKEEQRGVVRFLVTEGAATRHKFKTPLEYCGMKVILLHDNARPHTANLMRDKLHTFGWETHYNILLKAQIFSSSDFHIFGDLKKDIRGRRFHSDEEVQEWMRLWIHQLVALSTRLELIVSSPSGINVLILLVINFE